VTENETTDPSDNAPFFDDKCCIVINMYRMHDAGLYGDQEYIRGIIDVQNTMSSVDERLKFVRRGRELFGDEFKFALNTAYGLSNQHG
jgi:hypothetical protein